MTPFQATPARTTALAVTAASARIPISVTASINERDVLIFNAGEKIAFVDLGDATVVAVVPSGATLGAQPVPPGAYFSTQRLDPAGNARTHLAAICAGAETTTIYVTPGRGL